jgi:ribosomal protein L32
MEAPEEIWFRNEMLRRFGVGLRRVPETSKRTPDYALGNEAVFEIKMLRNTLEGGKTRKLGNGPSRIVKQIKCARGQLARGWGARVLVLLNDDPAINYNDLHAVLFVEGTRAVNDEARAAIATIDLFVWVDMRGDRELRFARAVPSSKKCSGCGELNHNLTLSDREWVCSHCGMKHDRDVNAAINLKNLAESSSVTACGATVRPLEPSGIVAEKQESGRSYAKP